MLYIFVELDKLITSQPILQQHWFQYRGCLNNIKLDPAKYDCNINDIAQLEHICNDIESTLLSGKIFEVCVRNTFAIQWKLLLIIYLYFMVFKIF